MDLILWRHAEAVDLDDEEDATADLERPLTPKGEKHARRMAEWLDGVLPESTRVIASPARRTRQTAETLKRKVRIVDALAPGFGPEALLAAARWPESRHPVLVVGHQPTLGFTVAQVLSTAADEWSIRKGAVWWLRHRERDGEAEVVIVAVRAPDLP